MTQPTRTGNGGITPAGRAFGRNDALRPYLMTLSIGGCSLACHLRSALPDAALHTARDRSTITAVNQHSRTATLYSREFLPRGTAVLRARVLPHIARFVTALVFNALHLAPFVILDLGAVGQRSRLVPLRFV